MLLTLLMMLSVGWASSVLFQALAQARAPLAWSQRVLGWAFTLTVLMLGLGDLHVAVAALVGDRDLERLRAAPLPAWQLVVLKAFATLPRTLPPVLGLALPAALAYASVEGGVGVVPLAAAMFALWAVPLGLGCALALPLLRLAPAAQVRESLAVLATFAFVAGWLVNAFWMPHLVGDAAGLTAGLRGLPAPPDWSPATWAANAVAGAGAGAWANALRCGVAGACALAFALWSATGLLAGVHARAAVATSRVVPASTRRASTLALAFLRRDAALAVRDWPVILDALASLALWSLLPLALLPVAPLPHLELARDMSIAVSVSLGNDIAARALPLERTSLAWARLSPVGGARWVRLRALGVALVNGTLLLTSTTVVCVALQLDRRAVVDVAAFALAATTAATATGLCVGAVLGDPHWTDPRSMLGAGGRTVSAVALLAQAGVWLALSHWLPAVEPLPVWPLFAMLAGSGLAAAALLQATALFVERKELAGRS